MYKDHSDSHPYLQYEKQNTKFLHADFVGFPTLGNLFRALDQQSDLSMKKKRTILSKETSGGSQVSKKSRHDSVTVGPSMPDYMY